MRKLALGLALLGMLAFAPARAETMHWADSAYASTQYSLFGAAGLVGVVGFALDTVFCAVFSQTLCPPDPNNVPTPDQVVAALQNSGDQVQNGPWAASQATGAPNTYPQCGDIPTAWAPLVSDVGSPISPPDPIPDPGNQHEVNMLAVFYNTPVQNATRVDIYETNIGSFVVGAAAILSNGTVQPIYSGPDTTPCPGILSIPLSSPNAIAGVAIFTQAPGWEEIDAVGVASD